MDDFVWLTHPDTGGYFKCPAGAVDDWLDRGWSVAPEAPEEPNPVLTEYDAGRPPTPTSTPKSTTPAARRGVKNGEMSDG